MLMNYNNIPKVKIAGVGTSEHSPEVKESRCSAGVTNAGGGKDQTVSQAGEGPLMNVTGCLYEREKGSGGY